MRFKPFIAALALLVGASALAQQKQRVERDADLPRFSYKIDGKLEDVVRDDAKFKRFAADLRRDYESVLAKYDIADKASERQYMGVLVMLDWLDGRYDQAEERARAIRALEEKPADKLTSGMVLMAMNAARKKVGDTTSEAYRREVGHALAADLRKMPYAVIENNAKSAKSGNELIGESLILGNVRDRLQPVVDKSGGMLSSDLAPGIVAARYSLVARLPLKQTMVDTYGAYLAENKVEKADIWKSRAVELPQGRGYAPVRLAVWDSGVDSALFKSQLVEAGGKPALIAFDRYNNPASGELAPIPAELQAKLPSMKSRTKGLSDLRSNVDSPEAAEVKRLLSGLKKEEFKGVIEELSLAGNYTHGTHVAGIAMEGNPYARLVIARIEFDYHLLPDPCPSKELTQKGAKNYQSYVDFLKAQQVRVVNMSWGGSVKDYETQLEECNTGKNAEERKALARELFDMEDAALKKAMASAPQILFVAAAGNSNSDASFSEFTPANIALPNLLVVGAVDKAGDEAPFTSYGPTVKVHANGYQVESYLPGGDRVALSGTSMSAPQVTNLAAKILAVNPKLSPTEVIGVIQSTAEKTADGRRVLVNPAKAVSAAQARAG